MKVVLVNGSPKAEGNTYLACKTVADALGKEGVDTEIIQIGHRDIQGCMACNGCMKGDGCVHADAEFKAWAEALYAADGVIFATPVYFSGLNGSVKSFLDRVFFSGRGRWRHKIGAGIAVVRRLGGMTAFQQLNAYFLISEMLIAPTFYWNVAYGMAPGEVLQDGEGLSLLQNLARNMAWMLKMKDQTKEALPAPAPMSASERVRTNFIR
ncbi:MAG: flavodoxin family protein [Clostridiales bacterium]|nr:flavodoxin family protein [Clostridiales bacterium]